MYVLHSRQGQLLGCHFLIAFFNKLSKLSSLNSGGIITHIFGPRKEMLSVP